MRVLVAGGAGFIGSHLCDRLVMEGHDVVCLDNLLTGRSTNVDHLVGRSTFTFIEADLIQQLPPMQPVHRIYHLASPASPVDYRRHPLETLRANSEGTRRLLELAVRDGARLLYASTSEVYGDPLEHPQRETYLGNVSSVGPRSMYDEAKRYGEALTMAYVRAHSVDARIVRIFNTYGPRSRPYDGRMVPSFVSQALRDEPITVYGDGSQTRSLCYVSDLVDGLLRSQECDQARGEVINLGNPTERSVREFAELIRELAGSNSEIVLMPPMDEDDPRRRQPNIERARALLRWVPRISLRAGLEQTIAYFREELLHATPVPARRWTRPPTAALQAGDVEAERS